MQCVLQQLIFSEKTSLTREINESAKYKFHSFCRLHDISIANGEEFPGNAGVRSNNQ
jgi:hypothetical protein